MQNPNAPHIPSPGSLIHNSHSSITRAFPYDTRPPSPPTVDIPASRCMGRISVTITPSPRNLDPSLLDLNTDYSSIIAHGGAPQEAVDQASSWEYSSRRSAQKIVDPSLWLGPLSVVRDKAWMEKEKVTMVVVKDGGVPAFPTLGPPAKKVCEELGVQVEAVGISGLQELIREFPRLNEKIVRHLVSVHKRSSGTQQGKVLVCCETGNERSAAVVVAYLVEVWGCDLLHALRFVLYRRFCVAWDDDTRRYLKNYEDILMAKRMRWQDQEANQRDAELATDETRTFKLKRQLAAVGFLSEDDDSDSNQDADMSTADSDSSEEALRELQRQAREYQHKTRGGRNHRNFAPFVERIPLGRRNNNDGTGGGS
ncbi:protein-tyrosine phosphatase-like protein [Pseudoneurospora amorphoporcata]|uniref:Protein-tyrosine phosphatase-like protein n=1 Tax=Pseudoneurospora amorphoporcata TaxID=241081 RepID=A0AAN6NTH2_9PEZI|nr:protein-tyrosine phosphatase-like protein [Pseudoneurospora amorphoporcata]